MNREDRMIEEEFRKHQKCKEIERNSRKVVLSILFKL